MTSIPYGRQYIDEDDISEVVRVLREDYITQGPKIKEFEEKLAAYCGVRYAVVFNSGTSALHSAYFAGELGNGDEFITSPITFLATSNAGALLGAQPVFVDVERETGNMDASKIEQKLTDRTKLIVPVHYAGHPADLEKVYRIAEKNNLLVIEDACHALGARYKGTKIGSCKYSEMAVFSFHPVKHITTGEGGAVVTNEREFYERLMMFRNHGVTRDGLKKTPEGDWYYEMHFLGYNYRLTDIQAALGISQLKKLDYFVERRRAIAAFYSNEFKGNQFFDMPVEADYACSSYHLYPVRLKDKFKKSKREIFGQMRKAELGVQVHYIPVYQQPYYQEQGYGSLSCPVAEDFYQREISIPIYPALKDKDKEYVAKTIKTVLEKFA